MKDDGARFHSASHVMETGRVAEAVDAFNDAKTFSEKEAAIDQIVKLGAFTVEMAGALSRSVTSEFPTTVRVGYRDYTIERWATRESTEREALGETSNLLGVIRVSVQLLEHEPVKAANTLLHEILHACWYVADLADEDKQERIVTTLANQISQVWRDNPHVIAWIDAQLKRRHCARPQFDT